MTVEEVAGVLSRNKFWHFFACTCAEVDRLLEPDVSRGSSVRVFGRANADGWAKKFRATVKAACRIAGVPAVGPHDLRRTFATILARAGLDPLALSRRAPGEGALGPSQGPAPRGPNRPRFARNRPFDFQPDGLTT
jgi:hypothetical protein